MGAPIDAVTQASSAALPASSEIRPGTMLGEYVVEDKIGQGGMGEVYRVLHPVIGKRAAIKVLKAEHCTDPGTVERFITEARIANQIRHPNIVDVFAFGETGDGRSYFVMELLDGESLRSRLARGRLSLAEIRELVPSLVRALAGAHEHGVVHRDLKPDNVFLVAAPASVKLLDFGVAKLLRPDRQMEYTATGVHVGTPLYSAPEQARGETIDHRADIYTLGGMLFEMLTGRPPFVGGTTVEVIAKHLMEAPQRPSAVAPVPRELDELVLVMLAKDPAARPSLAQVAAVIERIDPRAPLPAAERDRSIAATRLWWVAIVVVAAGAAAFAIVAANRGSGSEALPAQPDPRADRVPDASIVDVTDASIVVHDGRVVHAHDTTVPTDAGAPLDAIKEPNLLDPSPDNRRNPRQERGSRPPNLIKGNPVTPLPPGPNDPQPPQAPNPAPGQDPRRGFALPALPWR